MQRTPIQTTIETTIQHIDTIETTIDTIETTIETTIKTMIQQISQAVDGYIYTEKSTIAHVNKDFYEGDTRGKVMHGVGRMIYNNGDVYIGQWQNDVMHGVGRMIYNNGFIYIGQWQNNVFHGIGSMTYPDGKVYEGEWEDDKRHGIGSMTYPDGDFYTGQWEDGKKSGNGKYEDTRQDGHVYMGQWEDGKRHGAGKIIYSDRDFYAGQWEDGKKSGTGLMIYSDGEKYEGEWIDSKRHGTGIMKFSDGRIYGGEWQDNSMSGNGEMTYPDGTFYDGEWQDDSISGNGKMTYPDGTFYDGEWEDGKRHGTGIMNNNTTVDFYMEHQLPHNFYNVIKRSGTKILEIVRKINRFSKQNPGSLLYLFHSLLKHIEREIQIPVEIEIPVGTVFYRTISIKKSDNELETHISELNSKINDNVEDNKRMKNSLGIGSEGTFCNENPLDNIVIDLPGSINNAVSILRTRETFNVLNFNALQHLFAKQLKSGQTGNRGLIKECCRTGDMQNFLKNNNMGICLIDAADSMDLFKTSLDTFSHETNLIRLNELLPEQLRRDVNDMTMNVNDAFRISINEIRINDVTMDRVLPVYDSGTSCMYGTLGPEFFMPPDKFKIESVHSYTSFYVPGAPYLTTRTLSDTGIKLFPNINKYDIQPGQINGEDCHYIHPELAARLYIYNSMGISSSTVLPFLKDYAEDETILNSINNNFELISKAASKVASHSFIPRLRHIPTSNNSQNKSQNKNSQNKNSQSYKTNKLYKFPNQSQSQSQILMKKLVNPVKPANFGNKGGKKTHKKSKRRHNKTRRRSTHK